MTDKEKIAIMSQQLQTQFNKIQELQAEKLKLTDMIERIKALVRDHEEQKV